MDAHGSKVELKATPLGTADSSTTSRPSLAVLPTLDTVIYPPQRLSDAEIASGGPVQTLPPTDRGRRAWGFCAAAFMLETIVWGFGYSYGTFQEYYTTNPPFNVASRSSIAAVGTIALALQYGSILPVMMFCRRYPEYIKKTMWGSLVASVASVILSSWATKVWQLLLLQGVAWGLCSGFLYGPVILWLAEWFIERRGLATGLIFGGTGFGGAIFPIAIQALLREVGFRWTLRIWAGIVALAGGTALVWARPRISPTSYSKSVDRPRWLPSGLKIWRQSLFWAVCLTAFLQGLAYFPVSIYLPTFTVSFASSLESSIVLAIFNLAVVAGQVGFGHLTDRHHYYNLGLISGAGGALCVILFWAFAVNLPLTFVFAVTFGVLNSGYGATWVAAATDVSGAHQQQAGFAFSGYAISKGVSAVVGTVIASSLYDSSQASARRVFGSFGYLSMELFVAATSGAMCLSGLAVAVLSKRKMRQ